jgi:hypothetical protein
MRSARTFVVFFTASAFALPLAAQTQPKPQTNPTLKRPASASAVPTVTEAKSATQETAAASKLPVRRVVLYKTGVGYFEHQGAVHGDQQVGIDFTSGQLNDVLQSLTILDLNGGRIAGVDYNSEAPLSQRIGTLRLPLEEKTDLSKFYGALRGARLEIRTGTSTVTGRLLSVERKTRVSGGTTLEVDLATLVTDSGEVRSVELTPAVTVQLAEKDVNGEVSRYLSLLASVRTQDSRRMTISANGTGERQLYVSYISEVPIWKTTYRIVLPVKDESQPLLQGWAIVDNTVGEDWNNVELSLIAGAPQSFIQQLSQPYYSRRPVIPLPESAQLSPQTHESAMMGGSGSVSGVVTDPSGATIANAEVRLVNDKGQTAEKTMTDNSGNYSFSDLPSGNYSVEMSRSGFNTTRVDAIAIGGGREVTQNASLQIGAVTSTVTVTAASPIVSADSASVVEVEAGAIGGRRAGNGSRLGGTGHGGGGGIGSGSGIGPGEGYGLGGGIVANNMTLNAARAGMVAAAEGTDLGDLFEYKLKDRVTIHKNESALVPIVQTKVASEKVSLWNPSLNSARPLRALWLTNSSSLTLDGGSFSILENETFAGEGITDAIKPGEKRLLSYAADLGVRVSTERTSEPQHVTRVIVNKGTMWQTTETFQDTQYIIRNDDTTPRTMLIERPRIAGWKLADKTQTPDETTADVYRFRESVEPKSTFSFSVRETMPTQNTFAISNISDDQILIFQRQNSLNPALTDALHKIIEQKSKIAALDSQIEALDTEKSSIYDDQQRLRENLKALKGSTEERALNQRYSTQLNDQENRLADIDKQSKSLTAQRDSLQSDLDKMINDLTFDFTT